MAGGTEKRRGRPALRRGAAIGAIAATLIAAPALAQTVQPIAPSPPAAVPAAAGASPGFWERDALTGDWGGLRPRLAEHGITLTLSETAGTLGNVTGGTRTGFTFQGRFLAALGVDLDKALGLPGLLFYADAYQIHGHGLSAANLGGNLFDVDSTDAKRASRLHDLYLEQALLSDRLSIRLGQIAVDDEFLTSRYAAAMVNATFGWPGLPSADLSDAPIYPMATPGIRVRVAPDKSWSVMAAVFNGAAAGPPTSGNGNSDPQLRNPSGTAFPLGDDLLAIAELAYTAEAGAAAPGLPATYKLGAWYHSGTFDDQHLDTTGLSLADPASNGVARRHVNDFSIYAVIDQMIWRRPGSDAGGVGGFLRAMGAPDDRNLLSWYVDGGLNYLGPFPGRDQDIAGLALAYGRVSSATRAFDRDAAAFGTGSPIIRDYEAVLEVTYQAAVTPWWTVQPDFQYVIHPGGHVENPNAPGKAIGDAAIFGLRTSIAF